MQDPADEIAAILVDGKIIARFSGREEVGPWALDTLDNSDLDALALGPFLVGRKAAGAVSSAGAEDAQRDVSLAPAE